jgi:uncharacterized membrane protein
MTGPRGARLARAAGGSVRARLGRRPAVGFRSVTDTLGLERESQRQRSPSLARLLGWVSLATGTATLAAPPTVMRICGIDDSPAARWWLRAMGVRELGHAATLLVPRQVAWAAWLRVAGDVLDLAASSRALSAQRDPERRRRLGTAVAVIGGITLLDVVAAISANRGRRLFRDAMRVRASVTVNRPVREVYGFWRDFANLPRFMRHLESVRQVGDRQWHWAARAPAGRSVSWHAELVEDRPNEMIKWRSTAEATVPNSGCVRFSPAAGGRGTEVRVEIGYSLPGGPVGAGIARIFGEHPEQQIADDLRRFKQVLETGEIVRSDGSPDGTSIQQLVMQRPAQPRATSDEAGR